MKNIRNIIEEWLVVHNFISKDSENTKHISDIIKCNTKLPEPIAYELSRVMEAQCYNYGLIFAIKDFYEISIKVICLSICYLAANEGEDIFCRDILSQKQLSFGDWVNDVPRTLYETNTVKNDNKIFKFLKDMVAFYEKNRIVSWRNDNIGHGLMHNPDDISFFEDIKKRVNDLIQYFNSHPIPEEISGLDFEDMRPFILKKNDSIYIFESARGMDRFLYLNLSSGEREELANDYLCEKWKKYNIALSVDNSVSIWNRSEFLESENDAINGFYLSDHYYKTPVYMKNSVEHFINDNDKGIFLLQGGQSTGKSSFVQACDELNQHGKQKIKIISDNMRVSVRCFYCNRINITNRNDFQNYLTDIFSVLPDGEKITISGKSREYIRRSITNFFEYFRIQYGQYLKRKKILLMIDGIDELSSIGWNILGMLPDKDDIPENVYIILTCRNEALDLLPIVRDFVDTFRFTDRISFDINDENHKFMTELLTDRYGIANDKSEYIANELWN